MPEQLLHSTPDAPWLPAGGRAGVVRSAVPPSPVGLVRLLVRDGSVVFRAARQVLRCLDDEHAGYLVARER